MSHVGMDSDDMYIIHRLALAASAMRLRADDSRDRERVAKSFISVPHDAQPYLYGATRRGYKQRRWIYSTSSEACKDSSEWR